MNDSPNGARRRGTTLPVAYVLLGGILGASIGGWEAPRQPQSHYVGDSVYASRPDDDASDDEDARDPMVALPLLGLVSGTIVGAGTAQLHLIARRRHGQQSHG